ncbi:sarcosine oxidase subunit gamma [Acidisoma sp.]|uniref:sarcosine oxidase subunit gamma n=1 Tax=Acidisoma sp. TaxID=1872115 RepID=UPI003B00902A
MSDVMDATIGADGVSLETLPPFGRFIFRGPEGAVQAMSEAFGISLPREACRSTMAADRAALWLGPDEWLLLAPAAGLESIDAEAEDRISQLPHSMVDVSDRQVGLRLSGRRAATVLSGGVPLDLDPSAFPVGMCTRTVLAKAEIVLWRAAPESFHIEVWRSFAPYVHGFLREHMREFGN